MGLFKYLYFIFKFTLYLNIIKVVQSQSNRFQFLMNNETMYKQMIEDQVKII